MVRRFVSIAATVMVAFVALVFASAAPAAAGVQIRVNLNAQTMQVTTPDGEVRNWTISSGRKGFNTIRGNYRPYALKTYHWSRKYGGAMPHAIFFKGGYAIHGTGAVKALGRPASHGCIRLHPAHAKELFQMVKRHGQGSTRIAINGVAPDTGRTMIASGKKRAPAVARVRAPQPELIAPAYAPQPLAPSPYFPFQRLR